MVQSQSLGFAYQTNSTNGTARARIDQAEWTVPQGEYAQIQNVNGSFQI